MNQVRIPVLGMYGDKDRIVDPLQWQPLELHQECGRLGRSNVGTTGASE